MALGGKTVMKKISISRLFGVIPAIFALLISLVVFPQTVNAAECDPAFFSQNNIGLYSDCPEACESGSSVIGVGGGVPAETTSYLDGRNITALYEQNKARYEAAGTANNVKPQIIAALHYREAGMNPASSVYNGAALGSGTNVDGQLVVSDPIEDATRATKTLVGLASGVYGVDITKEDLTIEELGKAFLAYNRGYLYERSGNTYDQSPYVMNGFDEEHMNMAWVGPPGDPALDAGQIDGNKAGALAVLSYLGGVTGDVECSTSGVVAGDIVKTAIGLAMDRPAANGETDVSLTVQAYRDVFPQYNSAPFAYPAITDCGRFVSTVMRSSGADPTFAEVFVPTQIDYMNSSGKYNSLGTIGIDQMQPGDIVATPGHIIIFTGPNGEYMAADASYQDRVPSVRPTGGVTWMIGEGAGVWRLK